MSKKNLAKTAIEGGRTRYSKFERAERHRKLRARQREFNGRATQDNEYSEGAANPRLIEQGRNYRGFTDKLHPALKWLAHQCGRPWNDVYSEIKKKFDSRTTAGRHILYDHLLQEVWGNGISKQYMLSQSGPHGGKDFYVDSQGILCKVPHKKRKVRLSHGIHRDRGELLKWANFRKVIVVGQKLYWGISERKPVEVTCSAYIDWKTGKPRCPYMGHRALIETSPNGKVIFRHWYHLDAPYALRQGPELSRDEYKYFNDSAESSKEFVTYITEAKARKQKSKRGYW